MQHFGRSQLLASARGAAEALPLSVLAPVRTPNNNHNNEAPLTPGFAATISPQRLLESLRRRASWIIVAVLLCLGAGLAFSAMSTSRYVASARLIIDPRGLRVLDNELQPTAQTSEAITDLVESEMRVLKGTGVLNRVVDALQLVDDTEMNGSPQSALGRLRAALRAFLPASNAPPGDPRAKVLYNLDDRLAVRRIERSFVIEIYMTSSDAAKSARIANALVDAYIAQSADSQSEAARRSGAALSANLDEMQKRVRDAEDAVERFKVKHGLLGSNGRLLTDQQLGELSSQLSRAKNATADAQARVDQLKVMRQSGAASPEAMQSTTMSGLVLQLAEYKRRYAALQGRLGPRHPELAALRREVEEAQVNINSEIDRMAQSARIDLDRALAAERLIQSQIDAQGRTANTASQASVELRELERRAEASKSIYNAALLRSRQLQEQALLNSTNIRRVAPAVTPDRPANPPTSLILALALICGLGLGGAAVVGADAFKGRIHNREDLERVSNLPALGAVSFDSTNAAKTPQLRAVDPAAYLALLDALQSSGGRSIAVTSANADGSSSHVAYNLARAASSIGAKVLLVDAAVIARALTFELKAQHLEGIGACAIGKSRTGAVASRVSQSDILFLPADANAAVSLRHVSGRGLAGVIEDALATFTYVIVDLGCAVNEPISLTGSATQSGLMVVERERTPRPALDAALSACSSAKVRLAGVVLAGSSAA
ncbi:cryptic autophosphorylating protein tyrosine kinase Etk [Variibacter gotjawalensis]|uniref:Cryptic autophosphorylating protein tyrosine kinase Etk n=1 Tax=Variibacter gotjawalensis TaxID=1333996 RepID=A0A0S3PX26_9BRAD|nr:exopolysaccharide transport family protein [Variibacter gotjawalensis]NIK46291.1 uncharacterized protein involved in exopolysaccharide biosynthesis [Variibacter gotjawalensis]RZS48206.1 uncharacterized protein involved in exopolysaccharide biosynthesis [Variibacter gotjawalensis]BAT60463.1 cryptic autophosphorylating protein tyrosine kinase Etk [Variibacter gotjawalensis]